MVIWRSIFVDKGISIIILGRICSAIYILKCGGTIASVPQQNTLHFYFRIDIQKNIVVFYLRLGSVITECWFHCIWKINGKIPAKLGNTHISLKIREVFPLILSKSLDFVLFKAVNRNISAYIRFLSFPYIR